MDRRTFLSGVAMGVLAPPLAAQAPPTGKSARIGILTLRSPGVSAPLTEALKQGLRERGYIEGQNLLLEYPDALSGEDRLSELAANFVRNQVDVIVIFGPAPLDAARILGLQIQEPVQVRVAEPRAYWACKFRSPSKCGSRTN